MKTKTRSLSSYARSTTVRLIIGGLLLLFIVGDGLIFIVYGSAAALSGLFCLFLGLLPIILVIISLALIEWIYRHAK